VYGERGVIAMKLPLFPLNTVLFPGAPISLHIFEERYRLMIGQCLEQQTPFGVVLLRSGSEVSADDPFIRDLRRRVGDDTPFDEATPFEIGAVARITESQRLDDGRYVLVAVGQRRFRIQYIIQHHPYLIASVSQPAEDTAALTPASVAELRQVYDRYWARIARATGQRHEYEEPPSDAIELTYWLAHRLRVDNRRKQHWLEADVATRVSEMTDALQAEIAMLPPAGSEPGAALPWSWN
jgi:uncharacterized protein